ncbi:MAG: CDF family Co(II)/Ni(II) efflux transporter DmeF [Deltaproteobacteria bacterium]|nr:MAG: CDF family Co(II)/Ni(II) efflux transporter DmeF [Deltaproteobacteria bacterium]
MNRHAKTVERFAHSHESSDINAANERRTLQVVLLTGTTMAVEIIAGHWTGSMALLADGWHMGTHAFALGISYAAYLLARKHMHSEAFSFGTGKFGVLAGYTSAVFLMMAAVWMMIESVLRLVSPVQIAFTEAIWVTLGGLLVNFASVMILHQGGHHHSHGREHHHDDHAHGHTHEHEHPHEAPHHDHNYRAAYLHVIADTLTSVFALAALLAGRYLGWSFLDPVMGIVGGVLISRWAYLLIKATGLILLDGGVDDVIKSKARALIEADNDSRVADLHLWRVGSKDVALVVSVVTGAERKAVEYQARLKDLPGLAHISIEVHPCDDPECSCV